MVVQSVLDTLPLSAFNLVQFSINRRLEIQLYAIICMSEYALSTKLSNECCVVHVSSTFHFEFVGVFFSLLLLFSRELHCLNASQFYGVNLKFAFRLA